MPYFSIYCKLINVNLALRVGDLKLGHILNYFSQKIATIHLFILIKNILKHDFCLLVEPNLKNYKFIAAKNRNKVVFDYRYDFLNVW